MQMKHFMLFEDSWNSKFLEPYLFSNSQAETSMNFTDIVQNYQLICGFCLFVYSIYKRNGNLEGQNFSVN